MTALDPNKCLTDLIREQSARYHLILVPFEHLHTCIEGCPVGVEVVFSGLSTVETYIPVLKVDQLGLRLLSLVSVRLSTYIPVLKVAQLGLRLLSLVSVRWTTEPRLPFAPILNKAGIYI